ncbi:hypothetical protein Scep_001198 [Stephania cephalantha]|uniref:Uncharacterized protein n=1 Tax=Stephania cephalantha TaxID=152367 RepID=A0AAP0L8Z9_9MAGN
MYYISEKEMLMLIFLLYYHMSFVLIPHTFDALSLANKMLQEFWCYWNSEWADFKKITILSNSEK